MCWVFVTEKCPDIVLKFSKNLVLKFYFMLLGLMQFIKWKHFVLLSNRELWHFNFENTLLRSSVRPSVCPMPTLMQKWKTHIGHFTFWISPFAQRNHYMYSQASRSNCLSNAMHRQNINLPVCVSVCVPLCRCVVWRKRHISTVAYRVWNRLSHLLNLLTCHCADVPYEVNGTSAQWRVTFATDLTSSECADMPLCQCAVCGKWHIGTVIYRLWNRLSHLVNVPTCTLPMCRMR